MLRLGNTLVLIPETTRFRQLCESIAGMLESRGVSVADGLASLPEARRRVFARRYPRLARQNRR